MLQCDFVQYWFFNYILVYAILMPLWCMVLCCSTSFMMHSIMLFLCLHDRWYLCCFELLMPLKMNLFVLLWCLSWYVDTFIMFCDVLMPSWCVVLCCSDSSVFNCFSLFGTFMMCCFCAVLIPISMKREKLISIFWIRQVQGSY